MITPLLLQDRLHPLASRPEVEARYFRRSCALPEGSGPALILAGRVRAECGTAVIIAAAKRGRQNYEAARPHLVQPRGGVERWEAAPVSDGGRGGLNARKSCLKRCQHGGFVPVCTERRGARSLNSLWASRRSARVSAPTPDRAQLLPNTPVSPHKQAAHGLPLTRAARPAGSIRAHVHMLPFVTAIRKATA